ncbi:ecdysteroid kinase domain-containing protein [Phthorimaea operculella]|nr:ecdysteroid kinase domain-containing protein [Phthorimaea operculella]
MIGAELILRDLIAEIASEHGFNNYELAIKPITSGGSNYTSALFLVTVKCPGKKDVELFAKVTSIGEKMREIFNAKILYDREVLFYTKLSKIYRMLELKANVADEDRLVIPKFYGCKTELYKETVIMQNLTAEEFKMHDRREPVSWEYAASAIENLAKIHALSFAYQKENPEEFENMCKDMVFEYPQDDDYKDLWAKRIKATLDIIKNTEYKPRVAKLFEELGIDAMQRFQKPLGTKVIIHGDFRPDNIMYRRKGNEVEVITLDYQTMHVGCPATDLVYFIANSTDSAFRVKHHERLVDHYYEELSAAMQRLGVDPVKTYSRKLFDSELKQMMPVFLFICMAMLRVILVDEDKAPKVDDQSGMEGFMELPTTEAFIDRFNGAVEDCVRWDLI